MNDSPFVSALIVNYNSGAYAVRCIDTLLLQKNIRLEIIVIDNASKDNSVTLLKSTFNDRIKLISGKSNLGFGCANNAVAAFAQGDFLLLINPDTEIYDELFIFKLVSKLKKNKETGLIAPSICEPRKNNKIISFGSVGKAIIGEKNSHLIFKLADFIKNNSISNIYNSKFTIVGTLSKDLLSCSNNYVDFNEQEVMLSNVEFETKILMLDFVLFFYNSDSYKYTASGAFFDCVKYEIPFIAIKNDFFNYYQGKYGPIGYLEDDYESLEKRIVLILNTSIEDINKEINVFKNNLRTMKVTLKKNTNNFFENIK
jgi:glycosyltransferase involved in cell wall biosynthesis